MTSNLENFVLFQQKFFRIGIYFVYTPPTYTFLYVEVTKSSCFHKYQEGETLSRETTFYKPDNEY